MYSHFGRIGFLVLAMLGQLAQAQVKEKDSTDFIQIRTDFERDSTLLAEEKIFVDKHPQDTEIGKFIIENENKTFRIRFGGFAKLVAYYDSGLEDQRFYDMYAIPTDGRNPKGRFNMRVAESRLNTEIIGNTSLGTLRLFIEGDFLGQGSSESLRLRHAYGQYKGFLFGKTWSTIMDLESLPLGIDLIGTNAILFARNPQVRYEWRPRSDMAVNFAVEDPNINSGDGSRDSIDLRPQVFPDLVLTFKKRFNSGHIQVGGILRSILLENSVTEEVIDEIGYGINLSTRYEITETWSFLGQGSYGRGISRYLSAPFDIVPSDEGLLQLPRSLAWYAGVEKKINFRSVFTTFISQVYIPETGELGLPSDFFRSGLQLNASYLYDVLPNLRTGVEFIGGYKESVGGLDGDAYRLYAMAILSF